LPHFPNFRFYLNLALVHLLVHLLPVVSLFQKLRDSANRALVPVRSHVCGLTCLTLYLDKGALLLDML
jgi:hypothetical protein